MNYAKEKKEFRLKRLCIYHSIYITVWKMQNYKDRKGQWTPTLGLEKRLTTMMHETILGSDVIVLYLDCFLVA